MGYRGGTSQPLFGGRGRRVTPGGTGRRGHYLKAGRRVHHMHAVARGTLDVEFVERAAKVHSQTSGPGVSSMTCANAAALAVSGLAPVSRSLGILGGQRRRGRRGRGQLPGLDRGPLARHVEVLGVTPRPTPYG